MDAFEIKPGIHWTGVQDPNLRIFDIIMSTDFGTTYNSFVVKGSEKTALFDTVKERFWDEYEKKLSSIVDISKIDYLIISHTEPDHSGSIERLLALNPEIRVFCSQAAQKYLGAIINKEFEATIVKDNMTLDLGGKTLEFISAPMLHWPDSIYTYVQEDKALITCDSFGAHYCHDAMRLSGILGKDRDDYNGALKYYFDMIMGPFKRYMVSAIDKISSKEIEVILTGHGPVIDENPEHVIGLCMKWSSVIIPNPRPTVIMPYVSAYGYTEAMAHEIKRGVESTGIEVRLFDMVHADHWQVLEQLQFCDGMLFGSPTINSEALPPIWNLLTDMLPVVHGRKFASAFGSYGWSGEAVPNIISRLKQLRMKTIPGLTVNFKPSEEELIASYEYGAEFGNIVLGKSDAPKE